MATDSLQNMVRVFDGAQPSPELTQLLADEGIVLIDTYDEQLRELSEIRALGTDVKNVRAFSSASAGDTYIYFPRKRTIVRTLGKAAYRELRTNRNRELLTQEEQERFGNFSIAFAGLTVGNPGAVCTALEGGSRRMKLADFDPLSVTNLNRFRAGLTDLGVNKAVITAEQVLETDPFYEIELYSHGLTPENVETFLTKPRVDLLIEEMDALPLKIHAREVAKAQGVPVVMVTGNGDGILLDVERYDTEPNLPILNGFLPADVRMEIEKLTEAPVPQDKVRLARDFIGAKYLDVRLVQSFSEFGKTLVGIPQLAEASFLRGAALCHAAKAIALGRELSSGRYAFSFAKGLRPLNR